MSNDPNRLRFWKRLNKESWMSSNVTFSPKQRESNATFKIQTTIAQQLEQRWDKAVAILFFSSSSSSLQSDSKVISCSKNWYEKIKALYSNESERKYHTIWHLVEMFGYLDVLLPMKRITCCHKKDHERSVAILSMSTFFHDAIYNPRSSSNEEDSAQLYTRFRDEMEESILRCQSASPLLPLHNTFTDISSHDTIHHFIIQTKSHDIPLNPNSQYNHITLKLLRIFMDMDLSVLAKNTKAYDNYAHLIRQEYEFVERSVYCSKRAEILQDFLSCSRIFHSDVMTTIECNTHDDGCPNFETRARYNLEREIKALRSGIILGEDVIDDVN